MTLPVLWIGDNNPLKQAPVNAVVGRAPAGKSIVANLGDSYAGPHVIDELAKCKAAGLVPCVWASPPFAELDAGTVDLVKLPDHPSVQALSDAIRAHGDPVLVRLFYECCNLTPKGAYRYVSGAIFSALFDLVAGKLPGNAIPVWSFGPGFTKALVPIFGDWAPARAKLADVSMYRKDSTFTGSASGKQVVAFVQVAKALKLPLIVGESGLGGYFPPNDHPTDDDLKAHAQALIQWVVANDVRALAGPFSVAAYGMVPWTDKPLTAAYLKKKLGSAGFVSQPVVVVQQSPLAAAGLAAS